MKVKPAEFLWVQPKSGIVILALMATLAQAQNRNTGYPPPGAVQQPYYRQPGSAYVPPGTKPQQIPAMPQGYQAGYGTPPARTTSGYKPPTPYPPAKKTTPTSAPKSKSSSSSLESKVARLEKNDARQDQRISGLERAAGYSGSTPSSSPGTTSGTYTVRNGDTLWRIADRHSTSINALKAANRLQSETITIGQTLVIPGRSGSSSPSAITSTSSTHIVRPGDTFSELARNYGISQDALARANPSAYPDRLLIGERLVIPGKKTQPTPPSDHIFTSPAKPESGVYIVKRGESLGVIAKNHGIPTATLAAANKLRNANLIEPGQRLIIPGGAAKRPSSPAPQYPADQWDTAPMPGTSLLASPPPSSPAPSYHQPETVPTPLPPITKTPPTSSNRRGIVAYRLERGDDINTVASLFNTTPDNIREINKLAPDRRLKEGDEVVVPALGAVSLN